MYALKQFRHFLLGRKFQLVTDHVPLQWLSSQKMEGLLAQWALATQEFDFVINYRKGVEHSNADALSRQHSNHNVAVGHLIYNTGELKHQQHQNPVLCQLPEPTCMMHCCSLKSLTVESLEPPSLT